MLRRLSVAAAAALCGLGPLAAAAQSSVSSGGWVESDLWQNPDSPPEALLDGSTDTHFTQHRLEDSEWRVWLPVPATLASVTFVQGWEDWSQATLVRLETADGSTTDLTVVAGTRDPQTFPLSFSGPTAFVDVRVVTATPQSSGDAYGGFAEMSLTGTPVPGDNTPPGITAVSVTPASDTEATVTWSTDEPATTQLRYSSEAVPAGELVASELTPPDLALTTAHSVSVQATAPLRGQIEIRSADASGNRAELRHDAFVALDTSYQYGVGGVSFHLGDEWVPAPVVYAQDQLNIGFVQSWIGGDGWTEWYTADTVRGLADAGYTPEVIHYYFGDPVLADVQARSADFLADIATLAQVLADSGVGDRSIVTLEPEFNQGEVASWGGWNDLMIQAIDTLHSQAGCKVGILPGDWDIDHLVPVSMGRATAKADFVAFQEMRGSTQDTPDQAYEVPSRAIRFSHYLSRKFLRPVRLGYLMVSDFGGWEAVQRDVVIKICERYQELQSAGTVAVSWMSYLDSPGANGYFGEAEAHKGLKYADNTPKPAWYVFQECAAHGPSWLASGAEPPGAIEPDDEAGCACSSRAFGRDRGRPTGSAWAAWLLLGWAAFGRGRSVIRKRVRAS
jgi:hypothetical protein